MGVERRTIAVIEVSPLNGPQNQPVLVSTADGLGPNARESPDVGAPGTR